MKAPRFILTAVAALGLAAASVNAQEVLLDFSHISRDPDGTVYKCYEYTYGDWGNGKVIDLKGRGALVQASGGQGGMGENKTMLKLKKTAAIEVHYIIGNANQAGMINFSLTDKDGTEQTWAIPLSGVAKGAPQKVRFELSTPASAPKPGKTPGLDLGKLDSWQIRGDWSSTPVEVLLVKVVGLKK